MLLFELQECHIGREGAPPANIINCRKLFSSPASSLEVISSSDPNVAPPERVHDIWCLAGPVRLALQWNAQIELGNKQKVGSLARAPDTLYFCANLQGSRALRLSVNYNESRRLTRPNLKAVTIWGRARRPDRSARLEPLVWPALGGRALAVGRPAASYLQLESGGGRPLVRPRARVQHRQRLKLGG